ncbi:MAG TPA: nucleotide exchange factor GrpE [Gemmataceae bacterium]|jgi:molecular chaperone GrpE|nr:nucleotide exchange factor GrpE [Gemmataceae bacterium]
MNSKKQSSETKTGQEPGSPDRAPGNPVENAPHSEAIDTGMTVLDDLEALRTRSQERDQFLSLLQRTQADFENYQKRNQREREQERRYWHGALFLELLPVLDNLERTLAAARQANETGPLVQGVGMVLNQLLDLLKRHGVTSIDPLGQPFDPNLHEAVMQQPTREAPPNTITQVLERGFMIHDRVLRPAKVAVSVGEK